MFGSSALSSGLGLGVTAFGSFSPDAANDDDPDPTPPAPASALPVIPAPVRQAGRRANFYLDGDRELGVSWKDRARANVAAILVADGIAKQDRPATPKEQAQLIRFTGFGAGELANGMFRRPGEVDFRQGWDDLGSSLEFAVSDAEYVSLARCTQYAHFTPEFIIRAIWAGVRKLGWRGGRVLEPGVGTGLFPALMPEIYRDVAYVTGIELDPVTARIVGLLQPKGHRKVNGLRSKSPARHFRLCCLQACDFIPLLRGCGSQFAVMVGRNIVARNAKEIGDWVMNGNEALEVPS